MPSYLQMTKTERQGLFALASIYALRMLGLFMILPVFAIYAIQLNGMTPVGIGIALGIYGLTQAIFQIPFGYISDRLGRKKLIILGLLLLFLGSVVAAMSESITGVILGRAIQGMGATGSVIMAYLADITREEIRLRSMAFLGISIGASFALAFIIGPLLSDFMGVQGIFWLTAGLSLAAMGLLFALPNGSSVVHSDGGSNGSSGASDSNDASGSSSVNVFTISSSNNSVKALAFEKENKSLFPLYIGVLILHASLTAIFLKIPQAIQAFSSMNGQVWQYYLPILLASFVLTIPIIIGMERSKKISTILRSMILLLALSSALIGLFFHSFWGLGFSLVLFFTAFNVLEASLPSLISKTVASQRKGMALGIFSALQFLGLFLGGILGGFLDSLGGLIAVQLFCVILALVWFFFMFFYQTK